MLSGMSAEVAKDRPPSEQMANHNVGTLTTRLQVTSLKTPRKDQLYRKRIQHLVVNMDGRMEV